MDLVQLGRSLGGPCTAGWIIGWTKYSWVDHWVDLVQLGGSLGGPCTAG